MEKIKGIQTLVLDIMNALTEQGKTVISKQEIKQEMLKTSLKKLPSDRFVHVIDQAIYQLSVNKKIISRGYGLWTLPPKPKSVRGRQMYKPKICQALQPEYLFECPKCGFKKAKVSATPPKIARCPVCHKPMSIQFFRYHCPVLKKFIGNPAEQCELLHGSETRNIRYETDSFGQLILDKHKKPIPEKGSGMFITPMKVCYFAQHPNELGIQFAKRKIELFEERQRKMMIPRTHGF